MVPGTPAARPLTACLPHDGGIAFHAHRDSHVWTWAVAVAVAGELRRDLETKARTRLIVGGADAVPSVYHALARAPLDWMRVDIGLTDERWLRPDDPDSEAAAVTRHLLRDHARRARFETLTSTGRRIEDAVAAANAHAQQAPVVAMLPVGSEGQMAALFTDAPDYARALASRQAYVSFDASMSLAAAPFPRRVTVTPAGLARAGSVVLLMRGVEARRRFEEATSGGAPAESALAALQAAGGRMQVHWCP